MHDRTIRSIRVIPGAGIDVLDQTRLPHEVRWIQVRAWGDAVEAIASMRVRGAPLIGVTAAFGLALARHDDPTEAGVAAEALRASRPTAVNLAWALDRVQARLDAVAPQSRAATAWREAEAIAAGEAAAGRSIAEHGLALLRDVANGVEGGRPPERPLTVMTHCNAGWLATVDWGTALAPVYLAHEQGYDVHVWVSETRPRNQGLLTSWELGQRGVPHTVIADSAAGPLIRAGAVDAVIVGADRIAANGDVANKVGTYLKALACADAGVPFLVAAPTSTVDPACPDGAAIPIEERDGEELRVVSGLGSSGTLAAVRQLPPGVPVTNPAFDVTPARLVTAIITERGVASGSGLAALAAGRDVT